MLRAVLDSGQKIITDGLKIHLDAAQIRSYPGSGTTWIDLSGNGNNGTLTNGPIFNSANGGNIQTDGANDYINIPYSSSIPTGSTARTIEVWISVISYKYGNFLYHYGSQNLRQSIGMRLNAGEYAFFTWSDDLYLNPGTINVNTWINITNVYDGNITLSAYLNGSSIKTQTLGGTLSTTQTNITINAFPSFPYAPPYGNDRIAIFRLYNKALTSTEILQNYNAVKSRFGL